MPQRLARSRAPLTLLCVLLGWSAPAGAEVAEAVFEVHATLRGRDYLSPWNPGNSWTVEGSGWLAAPGRIVTNAHVVDDATYVEVRRHGDPRRVEARVAFVAHEADLALLEITPPAEWQDVEPLPLGPLPRTQQSVAVYGFPMGGDTLSVTQGVVSRVEHQAYVHSGRRLLAAQIDAAINPGNSGGPVVMDGQVVGVAMQGYSGADNIGYMIPAPVVRHVLEDVQDGRYDGFPVLGIDHQELQSPDLRRKYGLPEGRSGVLVRAVHVGGSADGWLKAGDVLLSIEGHALAPNGSVEFRPRERTDSSYFLDLLPVGARASLEVLREREVRELRLPLRAGSFPQGRVAVEEFQRSPRYLVYGGMVFLPLTRNVLQQFGPEWWATAPRSLVAGATRRATYEGEEPVFLSRVLAGPVNEGYHDLSDRLVESVDGVRPRDFAHFVQLVEGGPAPFVSIRLDEDYEIALERARVKAESAALLRRYGIQADRSAHLAPSRTAAAPPAQPPAATAVRQ